MCGIAGKTDWNNDDSNNLSIVGEMNRRLIHRGPDNQAVVRLDGITLGHCRLSIIDLSENANQPISSSDNRFHIIYNGEVYNFRELRKELLKKNIHFKSDSDAEVVLYSYVNFGVDCFKDFNGMFAFAIWDNARRELILARDRFGKKPLYYHVDKYKNITFASDLNSLTGDTSINPEISYEALNCYLALGYILSPMSIYKSIFKLEPASYIKFSDSGKKIEKAKYWDYSNEFRNKTKENEKEIEDNILNLLDKAVVRRMISDVPVGAFLSGGVDSSSITALMKKHHSGELHTFSVGFDLKSYNELPDADRVASYLGTKHHGMICNVNNGVEFINRAIEAYDEPFADNSLIPMIEVSKLASEYVKVVLSGDGADEIFAGYITYKADKYYKYARPIPRTLKKFLIGINSDKSDKKLNWLYKQRQFFKGTLHNEEKAHYLWRQFFSPEERVKILGSNFKEMIFDTDPFHVFEKYYEKCRDLEPLDRNLYVDAMTWLTDDILVKTDRATMFSSIEARCPYLDPELVSYAASIPASLKMKGMQTKYILKRSLRKILPDFVLKKKKSGFNAPVGNWIGINGKDEFRSFNKFVYDRKIPAKAV